MRTETINIYKFEELPEKVQDKIIESWRENDQPFFTEEIEETMKAFEKVLNVKGTDWSYNADDYNFRLSENPDGNRPAHRMVDDILSNLPRCIYRKGYAEDSKTRTSRIFRKTPDDCPWTGVCYDCSFADAVKELNKPENYFSWDMQTFCEKVFDYLFSSGKSEYQHWLSAECIREDIESNDYEFTAEGKIV